MNPSQDDLSFDAESFAAGPPAKLAPRLARAGALWVDVAPAGLPLLPLISHAAAGQLTGMGGTLFALAFLVWGGALLTVVVIANAWLLVRHRQTLGLAYFGLAVDGGSSARLLAASAIMWLLPPLGSWLACEVLGADGWGVALICALVLGPTYGGSAVLWSGPARRGLGDRLAGRRIVVAQSDTRSQPTRRIGTELLLLLPPCLALPLLAAGRGGLVGGVVAVACAGLPLLLRRRAQSSAQQPA